MNTLKNLLQTIKSLVHPARHIANPQQVMRALPLAQRRVLYKAHLFLHG